MGKFNGVAMLVTSSGRDVNVEWALSLAAFQYPVGMSVAWFLAKGKERGPQRDALAEKALEIGAEFTMFLDDDTISPNYTIQQLHYQLCQHPDAAVCGGIYCTKATPPEPLVFKEIGAGVFWQWKLGEVFECKGLGTGSMMIRTDVLNHISKPWFVDTQTAPVGESENYNGIEMPICKRSGTDDLYFCKKVSDAGYKILAHGGVLPVHVDSEGKFYSLPLDSYPCKEYEKEIGEALKSGKTNLVFKSPSNN